MNIHVDYNRKVIACVYALDVKPGQVYSWGGKVEHYLRVDGGSVCLSTWDFIDEDHTHFGLQGPQVEVAIANNLTIRYEA